MQESALGNEEEQLVSLLLSKGAAESALADEMGRLKVQEEVRILRQHPRTIYNCKTCGSAVCIGSLVPTACLLLVVNTWDLPDHGLLVHSRIYLLAAQHSALFLCNCR